jgi:beta-lactamase superfamily II metal-dependent hydrolase
LVALALWSSVVVRPAATGLLTVSVLDVGQGDAILASTPLGHQVLVDAGPTGDVVTELDRALPLTHRSIDLAVVSHNHSDHIGGFDAVARHLPIRELWLSGATHTTQTYRQFVADVEALRIPFREVAAGTVKEFDGVRFTVLAPLHSLAGEQPKNQHDASVVLLVEYGSRSLLLTGDLETEGEQLILATGKLTHPVDVLKIGHHGSRTSSSEAWLDALKPSLALISAGRANKFGHPHQTVIDRLLRHGITVHRTDEEGTIRVRTDGSRLWVESSR